jgi:hypothetical protein
MRRHNSSLKSALATYSRTGRAWDRFEFLPRLYPCPLRLQPAAGFADSPIVANVPVKSFDEHSASRALVHIVHFCRVDTAECGQAHGQNSRKVDGVVFASSELSDPLLPLKEHGGILGARRLSLC